MGQTPARSPLIQRFGHEWESWGDGVAAVVRERFRVTTWKFGSIHQSKVLVRYAHAHAHDGGEVGMCLPACRTRGAAMRQGLAWVERYVREGAPSVDAVFRDCFQNYPQLYRTRASVLEHIFFVIGNGYDWLDGAIVVTSIASPEELREFARGRRRVDRLLRRAERVEECEFGRRGCGVFGEHRLLFSFGYGWRRELSAAARGGRALRGRRRVRVPVAHVERCCARARSGGTARAARRGGGGPRWMR